jgi:hypothetical protein
MTEEKKDHENLLTIELKDGLVVIELATSSGSENLPRKENMTA